MKHSLDFCRSLALAVGMALATSCFAMIARLAESAGAWLLPALGLSVALVLAVAHAIGRLARRFPSALGVRTYVKAAFGNTASLSVVFLYLFMITLVAGVESNLYASVVQQLLPAVPAPVVVATVFAAVLAFNARGGEFSRHVQLVLVAFMLAGLMALAVMGVAHGDVALMAADTHGAATLPAAAVGAFFLFVGFEWVTSAQPGSRQAAAQLPRVLLAAVAVLGLVYGLFSAAVLMNLAPAALAGTRAPQLLLAGALWGEPGRWLLLAVSTAAVLMAFNAGVIGAARLIYALAREGCVPRVLARTAEGSGAPVAAVAATVAACVACSAAVRAFALADLLANVAAIVICVCYAALLAASLKLFHRQSRAAAAVEGAALATMLALLAALAADPATHTAAAVALAAGIVIFIAAAHAAAPRTPNLLQPSKEPA